MTFRCQTVVSPPEHPTYSIDKAIREALEEDGGILGDITSHATVSVETQADAWFISKATGIIGGICVADRAFEIVDPSVKVIWHKRDGDGVRPGDRVAQIIGSAQSILAAERVCLNFLQRMSGIASSTAEMTREIESMKSPTRLLDTRKTVPGLRLLDKWAVLIGGGSNHRMGLFDMMMIKDNHIAASGGLRNAIEKAHSYLETNDLRQIDIEVETRTLEEVEELKEIIEQKGASCRITRVMLDNMTRWKDGVLQIDTLQEAMAILQGVKVELEASGNVTLETVGKIASTGVTYVSCGALTHSTKAMDISLKITTR